MTKAFVILFLFSSCFISTVFSTLCEKYLKDIKSDDLLLNYGQTLNCLAKKADDLMKKNTSQDKVEKKMHKLKLECFAELKNPSEELTALFQCFKNYYEAKFDTSLDILTLENQPKGTDSASWEDEELSLKMQEEHEQRNEPTNVALYLFCVFLAVAIASLVLATIYSRYRIYKSKQDNLLGLSSQSAVEFGSSSEQYKKQIDTN